MTGPITLISDPEKLEEAWRRQYSLLAKCFPAILSRRTGLLVEFGCGEGQLTIPLAEKLRRRQIIGVDKYSGSYAGNKKVLDSNLVGLHNRSRIKIVVSDCRSWMSSQLNARFDTIISSEFLPEIDSKGMKSFFSESYRTLCSGGITVHSFLSSQPRNAKQRRLVDADSNPKWTKTPPVEWFSPPDKLVVNYLKYAGFHGIRRVRFRSELVIRAEAARVLLNDWGVKRTYWLSHLDQLKREGVEIPDWVIVQGSKLTNSPKS